MASGLLDSAFRGLSLMRFPELLGVLVAGLIGGALLAAYAGVWLVSNLFGALFNAITGG